MKQALLPKTLNFAKLCFLAPHMQMILISQIIDEKEEQHVRLLMLFVLEFLLDALYVPVFYLASAEINVSLLVYIVDQV